MGPTIGKRTNNVTNNRSAGQFLTAKVAQTVGVEILYGHSRFRPYSDRRKKKPVENHRPEFREQPPANPHQAYAAKAVATLGYEPKKRRRRRTLNDLIKLFEDERLEGGKARLASNYTTIFEVLRSELGGAMLLDHIDRDDMRKVRDVILSRRLAPATHRKYCRGLGTLFGFAEQEEWIESNPALGLAPKPSQEEDEDRRRPFTQLELIKLFPDGWTLTGSVDWMLALGLFAGLRGEEAAQIEVSDVQEIDGIWSLHIRPWTETEDDGRDYSAGKRVKNRHSWRTVPIHPLICADLVALAQQRADIGEKMLLDGVKKWGKEGYYGSIRKDVFARLTERGVKTGRTSHHSLRHNFRDALRRSKMVKDHQLALGGWSLGKGAEADYGEGFSSADLAPSMALVTFPIGRKGAQDKA